MQSPQGKPTTRCPVYLHQAAASSTAEHRTGLRVIVGGSHQASTLRPFAADLAAA